MANLEDVLAVCRCPERSNAELANGEGKELDHVPQAQL